MSSNPPPPTAGPTKSTLLSLPPPLLLTLLESLPPSTLLSLASTCRTLHTWCTSQSHWKQLCLNDWPWVFYDGRCERGMAVWESWARENGKHKFVGQDWTLQELAGRGIVTDYAPEFLVDDLFLELLGYSNGTTVSAAAGAPTATNAGRNRNNPGLQFTMPPEVVCVLDPTTSQLRPTASLTHFTCTQSHPAVPNSALFLPESYYHAYRLLYTGQTSSLVQVLGSLENRPMSAFLGLATYDKSAKCLNVGFGTRLIARWRRGQNVVLTAGPSSSTSSVSLSPNGSQKDDPYLNRPAIHVPAHIEERYPLPSSLVRLRRPHEDLLTHDPREPIFTHLFHPSNVDSHGQPRFAVGEEVEIQWRITGGGQWAWWRGYVMKVICRPDEDMRPFEDDLGADEFNQGPNAEVEGITVCFPQYPPTSPWHTVTVGYNGTPSPNPITRTLVHMSQQVIMPGQLGLVGGIRKVICPVHRALWRRGFAREMRKVGAGEDPHLMTVQDGPGFGPGAPAAPLQEQEHPGHEQQGNQPPPHPLTAAAHIVMSQLQDLLANNPPIPPLGNGQEAVEMPDGMQQLIEQLSDEFNTHLAAGSHSSGAAGSGNTDPLPAPPPP
ncbi:hypothetical protein DFS34DRAFT_629519 [Phlyctochytrium arcticum]|nr:hypothetical protein DFS34DRAFT_629519 [Phlyctochytrium arcticum]